MCWKTKVKNERNIKWGQCAYSWVDQENNPQEIRFVPINYPPKQTVRQLQFD